MRSLVEVTEQLDAALDEAQATILAARSDGEIVGYVTDLQAVRSRLDATIASALAATERLGVPARLGQRSAAAVIGTEALVDPRLLGAETKLGAWLEDHPTLAGAFAAGTLSRAHLTVVRSADNPRTHHLLPDAEAMLVSAAETCSFHEFRQAVRYWLLAADPDGDEPADQRAARTCRLTRNADGTLHGRFTLDPVAAQTLLTALAGEERALRDSEQATDEQPAPTAGQRRADALVSLLARGAGRPDGAMPRPLVHIVVSEGVLAHYLSRTSIDDDGTSRCLPLSATDIDGRCEFADGTPLHPAIAVRLLATAVLRRLVLRNESEVVDLGRAVRTYPTKLKEALMAAARGRCQHPGCDSAAGWLEADHIVAWARHGPTSLDNGQLLCRFHNGRKGDGHRPRP